MDNAATKQFLEVLEADCHRLSQAIRESDVPRQIRKRCRTALTTVFRLRGEPGSLPDAATLNRLRGLASDLDALLTELSPSPKPDIGQRIVIWEPIRIRFAIRPQFTNRLHELYMEPSERRERIVEWFWTRCAAKAGLVNDSPAAPRELYLESSDLEYVWGRRKR